MACSIYDADPRTVSGAMDGLARALEAQDGQRLFQLVDQRARHALASIVKDRRAAAELIRADYPGPERDRWLQRLGDAAEADDASGLFQLRCTAECMADLSALVGAPSPNTPEQPRQGQEIQVQTARNTTLHMYTGTDGWLGVVWQTQSLMDERTRAARELVQIRENAEVYRRRRVLQRSLKAPASGSAPGPAPAPAQPGSDNAPSL